MLVVPLRRSVRQKSPSTPGLYAQTCMSPGLKLDEQTYGSAGQSDDFSGLLCKRNGCARVDEFLFIDHQEISRDRGEVMNKLFYYL